MSVMNKLLEKVAPQIEKVVDHALSSLESKFTPPPIVPAFEFNELSDNRDRYLMDENALLIFPTLACVFGVTESIILQQVHYFVSIKRERPDKAQFYNSGFYWMYASYKEWDKQLPYFSRATIKRALKHLKDIKILLSYTTRKNDIVLTYYTLDYQSLAKLINAYEYQKNQCDIMHQVVYNKEDNIIVRAHKD